MQACKYTKPTNHQTFDSWQTGETQQPILVVYFRCLRRTKRRRNYELSSPLNPPSANDGGGDDDEDDDALSLPCYCFPAFPPHPKESWHQQLGCGILVWRWGGCAGDGIPVLIFCWWCSLLKGCVFVCRRRLRHRHHRWVVVRAFWGWQSLTNSVTCPGWIEMYCNVC